MVKKRGTFLELLTSLIQRGEIVRGGVLKRRLSSPFLFYNTFPSPNFYLFSKTGLSLRIITVL
jgi:hypothetical protein